MPMKISGMPSAYSTIQRCKIDKMDPNAPCTMLIPQGAGKQPIAVEGATVSLVRIFNKFYDNAKDNYALRTLESGMNPYMPKAEQKLAQNETDNAFIEMYMKGIKSIVPVLPDKHIIESAFALMKEVRTALDNFAGKILKSKQGRKYLENAENIVDLKIKLNTQERIADAAAQEMKDIEAKFAKELEQAKKIELAKQYDAAANKNEEAVKEYNRLLVDVYAPLVTSQQKLAKEITNTGLQGSREAFHDLFGGIPKSPKDKNGNRIK